MVRLKIYKMKFSGDSSVSDKLTTAEDDLDKLHSKKESLTDRQHYFDLATTLLREVCKTKNHQTICSCNEQR